MLGRFGIVACAASVPWIRLLMSAATTAPTPKPIGSEIR